MVEVDLQCPNCEHEFFLEVALKYQGLMPSEVVIPEGARCPGCDWRLKSGPTEITVSDVFDGDGGEEE